MIQTLFGIASCSKAFLSTSIGLLMDDYAHGRNVTPLPEGLKVFDWDTRVKNLLPKELNWSLKPIDDDDSATRNAKIKDILAHLSGLPTNDLTFLPGDTTESMIRRMGKLRTAYELREQYSYNNQVRAVHPPLDIWAFLIPGSCRYVVLQPRGISHRTLRQHHTR